MLFIFKPTTLGDKEYQPVYGYEKLYLNSYFFVLTPNERNKTFNNLYRNRGWHGNSESCFSS